MIEPKSSTDMSTKLLRAVERARRNPHERQFALAHLVDVEALRRAFGRLRKDAAVGIDGVTKEAYEARLEENLQDLYARLRTGRYRHQPLRRIHIPKEKGRTRPIGISAFEDKIVQAALQDILQFLFEPMFRECSFGFRPKRGAHDALRAFNRAVKAGKANVILEADVESFFDSVARPALKEMLQKRISDQSLMRLIGKCLRVGILDGGTLSVPELGTAQGSVLSPILGNVYLHFALDEWFEQDVKPRLKGSATLIRYCDDFVICFERSDDAERVLQVLGKRLDRFGLRLHPDKTRLIDFRRPPTTKKYGKGSGSLEFLGFAMYWRRNAKALGWHLAWKTRSKSLRRAILSVTDFCRSHRRWSIPLQHAALTRRLQGHFNYFGVNDNIRSLQILVHEAGKVWFKWLNRRSQKSRLTWKRFNDLLRDFALPKPKICVNLWVSSP